MVVRIIAAAIGAALVTLGAALVYPPAGLLVAGGMLLGWGLLSDEGTQ